MARLEGEFGVQPRANLVECDAILRAGVAVADGDGLVGEGVGVDGEAEWATGFVHAGVAFADGLLGIGFDEAEVSEAGAEVAGEFVGDLGHAVLIDEREDSGLDRGEARVEAHELFAGA